MKSRLLSWFSRPLLACALLVTSAQSHADILVSQGGKYVISKHRNDGSLLKADFIKNVESPTALLVHGQFIYLATGAGENAKVARYNLDGTVSASSFIALTGYPSSLASDGTSLYVADGNGNKIGKYNLASGAVENENFITGVAATYGVLFYSGKIFATSFDGDYVRRYSLLGTMEASLTLPAGCGATSLAVNAAGNILVGYYNFGTIGEFKPNFDVVNASLVTGLGSPAGIAVLPGGKFAVVNAETSLVSLHNTNGSVANSALLKNLAGPYAITYTGVDTPYPKPAVTVKGAAKRSTTKSQIVLSGTAKNAESVKVSVAGKPAKTAKGTAKWTYTAKLKKGKNKITIVSQGKGGTSKKVTVSVTRKVKKSK